jgi:hypothetical protein
MTEADERRSRSPNRARPHGERGILDRDAGSPSIRATRIERLLEPSR